MFNKKIFPVILVLLSVSDVALAEDKTYEKIYSNNEGDCTSMFQTVIENNSVISHFDEHYSHWKREEKWDLIIAAGEAKYVQLSEHDYANKALLCARLSSSYFYVGNYTSALEKAREGARNAELAKNDDLLGRNLYLASAVHRSFSQNNVYSYGERKEHSENAQKYIDNALSVSKKADVNDFTKGKIAFNAAALAHDVKYDYPAALIHYERAAKIFGEKKEWKDDYDRTKLREIRVLMDMEKSLKEVLTEALLLDKNMNPTSKTKVHSLQLLGKIYFSLDENDKSLECIEKALVLACEKNMKGDIGRLESLKKEIDKKIAQSWQGRIDNQKTQSTYMR